MRNNQYKRRNEVRERGIAIVATAAWITIAIPFIGLGIDTGVLWGAKARISSACDAASLAAARSLSTGGNLEQQLANATSRGRAFFKANFPPGSYGSAEVFPTINVIQPSQSVLEVSATASAVIPLYFLRYLGPTSALAVATGRATRRDANVMLVLDRSASMAGKPCLEMKQAAKAFAGQFMSGRDRLGLITFSSSAALVYPLAKNFNETHDFEKRVDEIVCEGWTSTADAYFAASQHLMQLNEPGALNLVVLFSDGTPTAFRTVNSSKTEVLVTTGGEGGTGKLDDGVNLAEIDANGLSIFGDKEVELFPVGHIRAGRVSNSNAPMTILRERARQMAAAPADDSTAASAKITKEASRASRPRSSVGGVGKPPPKGVRVRNAKMANQIGLNPTRTARIRFRPSTAQWSSTYFMIRPSMIERPFRGLRNSYPSQRFVRASADPSSKQRQRKGFHRRLATTGSCRLCE